MAVEILDKEMPHKGGGVFPQYVDVEQQSESYIVGMWTFLVTEVMFFGALFFAYVLYRWMYQPEFYTVHKLLDIKLGATNTVILLTSSLTMALGVHYAQLKRRCAQILCLLLTIACAFGFLVVKYFEYSHKIHSGLFPGAGFQWSAEQTGVQPSIAQMFFSLYFAMTGLHGLHVLVGILVIGGLTWLVWRKSPLVEDYVPTEMVGLYWHFVDLVWIFLFPLFYLLPK
jgi:cytochrome c oxidase subunit 3